MKRNKIIRNETETKKKIQKMSGKQNFGPLRWIVL
jgi:hypothetical protein